MIKIISREIQTVKNVVKEKLHKLREANLCKEETKRSTNVFSS